LIREGAQTSIRVARFFAIDVRMPINRPVNRVLAHRKRG
jgi:hypothetical protein